MNTLRTLIACLSLFSISSVFASPALRPVYDFPAKVQYAAADSDTVPATRSVEELNAYLDTVDMSGYELLTSGRALPPVFFMPSVFTGYEFTDEYNPFTPDFSGVEGMEWIESENALSRREKEMQKYLYTNYPERVPYNVNLLPEAPKRYYAQVDPAKHTISFTELPTAADGPAKIDVAPVKKRHWLRTFTASLQFSQAYVSPNWYQGGNNNLIMLANILYNVKLNTEYHPNLLFETTAQYKLGLNNAPDDSIHAYNISDDVFQVNTTFGVKAARRWYYSFTGQFKTQLLNSYNSNSHDMRSAFLSPGELNLGIGMTYNYANAKKTVTFDASMSPLSYNLKTCINDAIDATLYNIEAGRHTKSKFGSSADLKFFWKICHNIGFTSHMFMFTDYDSAQVDWENTLQFEINRFLTTQIYAHLRYDSATPACDDPSWKKLQVKEILSIGFAYKFSTL